MRYCSDVVAESGGQEKNKTGGKDRVTLCNVAIHTNEAEEFKVDTINADANPRPKVGSLRHLHETYGADWFTSNGVSPTKTRGYTEIAMQPLLEIQREDIARICRQFGVRRLEAFGSVLREDFDAARSDIDLLVEFEPDAAGDFSNFLNLKQALEDLLQRPVDLLEPHAIVNRRLRHHINQSKASVYDAA